MRFAQQLRGVKGIYSQYVCYKTLKKLINAIEQEADQRNLRTQVHASQLWNFDSTSKTTVGSISASQIAFVKNLELEIVRVKNLHASKTNDLRSQLTDIFRRMHGAFSLELLSQDLDEISRELVNLDRFIRQAKLMLYKILKKHDRRTNLKAGPMMLARLEQEPFWNPKFDDILVGLSDAYSFVRNLESGQKVIDTAAKDRDVEKFERKTEKYFVRPEDIMWVKTTIAKHLPVDIFNRKPSNFQQQNNAVSDALESLRGVEDSSVVNSIYLDNEELVMYHERIGFETPRGNLIRIRWYGGHVNPPDYVFMERKTRQTFGNKVSVDDAIKERFRIKHSNVAPYLTGEWTTIKKLQKMVAEGKMKKEKADDMLQTSMDIQSEIVGKQLGPAVRTVCRRTAFQQGKDQTLRFSLDTNLHMIDEAPCKKEAKNWFRNLEDDPIELSEVIKFPFAVLEVKTQKDPPHWVQQLKDSPCLIKAERFSKFLYGTARLRPLTIRFTPPWYELTLSLQSSTESLPKFQQQPSFPPQEPLPMPPITLRKVPSITNGSSLESPTPKEVVPKRSSYFSPMESENSPLLSFKMDVEKSQLIMDELPPAQTSMFSRIFKRKSKPKDEPPLSLPITTFSPPSEKKSKSKLVSAKQQRAAKSFFANERTLLSWINTVTFMSLAGLTLLNTGTNTGRLSGFLMILVTIGFAVYALFKFRSRLNQLTSQTLINLEDRIGPIILITSLCAVLAFVGLYLMIVG